MGGSGKWMESSGQQQVSEAAECQRLMWLPETFKNRQNSQTGNDTSLFFHCSSSLARSLAHAGTHGHRRIAMETDKRRAGPQREVIDKACEEMGRSAGSR